MPSLAFSQRSNILIAKIDASGKVKLVDKP